MEENKNDNLNQEEREYDISYLKRQWCYKTIAIIVILGCIIGVAASSITYYVTLRKKDNKFIESTYKIEKGTKTTATDSIDDLAEVLEAFAEIVDEQYIGDIEKSKLISETVKGFIKGIGDDYSEYMTSEEWKKYQEDALGNYSGVGIIMTAAENGYILVTNVIKDSPAEKSGILQGDYIVGVDDESVYEMSTSDVANKVRGEAGTSVKLNISRENESDVLEFNLTRENVRVYHVEGKMLDDNIGYVYFNTFDEGCADEFEKEMDSLVKQGANKVILDLRYNTGGAVDQALQILDLFLEKGQIELITQSANGPKLTTSSSTDRKYKFDNIIILTNEYTASASEILTGALIDNGLAKTVGTKTYGKGVMQSVLPLSDGSILKLTTQEYNTPNGTKINGIGISPNYEVEYDKSAEEDNQLERAKSILKGEE